MEAVTTLINGPFKGEIFYDTDPQDPRDWDNLGQLYIPGGRKYTKVDETILPDYVRWYDRETGWWDRSLDDLDRDEFETYLDKHDYLWLPVYRYEHSSVAYNTTGFSCKWDSGQVGYIMVPLSKVRKEYGVKRVSKKLRERVLDCLRGEVETYSNWANGDVYGYVISKLNDGLPVVDVEDIDELDFTEVDSCWGFYDHTELTKELIGWLADRTKAYQEKLDKVP